MDANGKPVKLIILIPAEASILYDSAMSILNLFCFLKANNIDFQFYSTCGAAHAFARNILFKKAHDLLTKEEGFTHILLLDSDHVFPPEAVTQLIGLHTEFKSDILGAGYLTKQEPVNMVALTAVKYSKDDPKTPIRYSMMTHFELNKVYTVDAVGFGMVVMQPEVLMNMVKHYETGELCEFPYREGIVIGEDVSFCQKAKAIGYKVEVTTAVMLGHVTSAIMDMKYAEKLYNRNFDMPKNISSATVDKDGIEGWLTDAEGILLENLARENKTGNIVEIGSWKGKSTIRLAKGTIAGKKNMVFAIDPHTGSPEHKKALGEDLNTYQEFEQNIKKAGVENYVVPIVETSEEAAITFNAPVGLVFVDGNHEYEYVKKDFDLWYPKLVSGGIIAFHDNNWPGPKKLIDEISSNPDLLIKSKNHVDTITYFEKH